MGIRLRADRQANQVEKVLKHHSVPLHVAVVDVGPRWTIFHSVVPLGQTIGKIRRLAEEIAMMLGASACRIDRNGSFVDIKVPHDVPVDVNLLDHLDLDLDMVGVTCFLGVDETGNPLYIRLDSDLVSHILIAGITGSGKTELTRSMIVSLISKANVHELGLILIDPKRRGYGPFEGLPHLCRGIVDTVPSALAALRWVIQLMEQRDREGQSKPHIVVFIDEVADLILQATDVVNLLTRLLQRGRQAGVHVVACTQKPTAAVIGSLVKSNFPVRIVGSVATPEDAKVASGLKQTGAEKLLGRGDFLLVTSQEVVGFQGARVSEDDIRRIVLRLRGGQPVPVEKAELIVVEPDTWVDTSRSTGRPSQPPTDDEIEAVLAFWSQNDKPPSLRWIRRQFGTRNDRARRIMEASEVVRNETMPRVLSKTP